MSTRPELNRSLNSNIFRSYYYLKEELVAYCRREDLQTSGSKSELTERIAIYLDSGKKQTTLRPSQKTTHLHNKIAVDSKIEPAFVCTEKHRAFFKQIIGHSFSFPVAFQKWLKNNTGKSYGEAIAAYYQILEEKKKGASTIDQQFEYNTYIRNFFTENPDKTLKDAIRCWKYKKSLQGHHRYEPGDLMASDLGTDDNDSC